MHQALEVAPEEGELALERVEGAFQNARISIGLAPNDLDIESPLFLEAFRRELALAVAIYILETLEEENKVERNGDEWKLTPEEA